MKIILLAIIAAGTAFAEANFWRPTIGGYAGMQDFAHWRNQSSAPGSDLVRGGVLGARLGWDLTNRWAVETNYGYGINNLRLFPVAPGQITSIGPDSVALGARSHHLSLNPVFHFTSQTARLRPYLTAGPGIMWYDPTAEAQAFVRSPEAEPLGAVGLDGRYGPSFNWGGGIKIYLTRAFEFRLDARNVISQTPHFALPATPAAPGAVYISPKGLQSGFQFTGGFGLRTALEGPNVVSRQVRVTLIGDRSLLVRGQARALSARTDLPPDVPATYSWTQNGQSMDTQGPNYTLPGRSPGAQQVCVSVAAPDRSAGSDCATITIVEREKPGGIRMTLTADPREVIPGQSSRATAQTDLPSGVTPQIAWTVNGKNVPGGDSTYTFDSKNQPSGNYEICAAARASDYEPSRGCATVVVRNCGKPSLRGPGDTAHEVLLGEKLSVPFTTGSNACGMPPHVTYRATEGTVRAAAQGAEYDSTGVGFNMSDRSRVQRKTVTIAATATDQLGATATAEAKVVVKLAPVAQRLDDIVFSKNDTRVNNCGKRVLLEVLAPKLQQDPNARVILVGHRDSDERQTRARNGRKRRSEPVAVNLDRARVLNAAAIISAGAGICPSMELSRVQVSYAGTTQNTLPLPSFCGGSTEARGKRASARDQRAQFRRVEVWVVPEGAPLPEGVNGLANPPSAEIRAKGCPK
jgi:outer membrane protein OmpA-like peptidoglycan-associated protein